MEGVKPVFTPGPWKLVVGTNWVEIGGSDDYFVATLGDSEGVASERNKANGHLIAEAPDLYDLAVDFERMLTDLNEPQGIIVGDAGTPEMLERVRTIIAKVKGE